MSNKTKRFILPEEEIPHYWYNIQADMVNKPMPPLNPATKQPLKAEDLYPVLQKSSAAKNSIRPMPGLKYPNRCAKCTNTTEALRWCVPTDWKSAGYTGTYLFQKRECEPDGVSQTELRHTAGLLLQAGGCDKRHHRNRSRTMGSFAGLCRPPLRVGSRRIPGKNQL